MRGAWRILLVMGISMALAGCGVEKVADPDDPGGELGKTNPITLQYGQSTTIEQWDIVLSFADVPAESRCPEGVQCFWQGEAIIQLAVTIAGGETHLVNLPIYGGASHVSYQLLRHVDTLGFRFTLLRLDPYPVHDVPVELEDYVATLSVFPFEPMEDITGEIQVTYQPADFLQNESFQLDTAWIEDYTLHVDVHYSGGCKDHEWVMSMSPATFMESYPVQANLFLSHEDYNDACDAWIGEYLTFDLRPVEHLYMLNYADGGPLYLNLYHYFQGEPGEKDVLFHCVNGVCPLDVEEVK